MHMVTSKFLSGTGLLKIPRRTSSVQVYVCICVWLGIIKLWLHEAEVRAGSCSVQTVISESCSANSEIFPVCSSSQKSHQCCASSGCWEQDSVAAWSWKPWGAHVWSIACGFSLPTLRSVCNGVTEDTGLLKRVRELSSCLARRCLKGWNVSIWEWEGWKGDGECTTVTPNSAVPEPSDRRWSGQARVLNQMYNVVDFWNSVLSELWKQLGRG